MRLGGTNVRLSDREVRVGDREVQLGVGRRVGVAWVGCLALSQRGLHARRFLNANGSIHGRGAVRVRADSHPV